MRIKKLWLATIAALLCSLTVSAHDFEVKGVFYNIISNADLTVEVTYEDEHYPHASAYHGVTSLEIPSTVVFNDKTYKVESIGDYAFYYCNSLTSITIPESIKSIGNEAFLCCSNLTSIEIPQGVESIQNSTFAGCSSLTSMIIPEGVISIGESSFSDCDGLVSVIIPASVKSIGNNAFRYCDSLASIVIPNSVNSIGDYAFSDCINLTRIVVPESVTSIGKGSFYNVEEVVFLPITPPTLVSSSIADFSAVIVVPVEAYDSYCIATYWSDMISNLTVNDEEKRMKEVVLSALDDGSALSIAIGENNLKFVTNLTIRGTINSYDFAVLLERMPLLRHLDLGEASIVYNAYEHNKREHSEDNQFPGYGLYGCKLFTLILPQSITSIGRYAIANVSKLKDIIIPNGVISIDESAFQNCSSLSSITIPEGVTNIGSCAFYWCSNLSSVTIPESVKSIASSAFYGCSNLISVFISDIGSWCSISFEGERSNPLCNNGGGLYLNGQLITNLNVSNVESINSLAFYNCDSIESVTISEGVTSVGERAFADCKTLTTVTMPESVVEIGDGAFEDCLKLTSINVPKKVTEIKNHTFRRCEVLTSIELPEELTFIGSEAFFDCMSLTSVSIPQSVQTIEESAFSGCRRLSSVTIPEGVTEIKPYTFAVCWGLTSITIPNSVTKIGAEAFYNSSGLKTVVLSENLDEIGNDAFKGCSKLSKIICNAAVPPKVENAVFADNVYENAILYVPMASLDLYKTANEWSRFFNISDVESDIDSLEWLVKSPQTVYDLRGNCINNIEVLGGGVYIVNGRKVLIK